MSITSFSAIADLLPAQRGRRYVHNGSDTPAASD